MFRASGVLIIAINTEMNEHLTSVLNNHLTSGLAVQFNYDGEQTMPDLMKWTTVPPGVQANLELKPVEHRLVTSNGSFFQSWTQWLIPQLHSSKLPCVERPRLQVASGEAVWIEDKLLWRGVHSAGRTCRTVSGNKHCL